MPGFSGTGIQLQISDMGGTPVWTAVANIVSIKPPGVQRSMIDVTTHDSPNGDQEEVSGRKNTTDLTMTINWDPGHATHDGTTGLGALANSGDLNDFRIVFPTDVGVTWAFSGRVSQFDPADVGLESPLQAAVTIRVTAPLNMP